MRVSLDLQYWTAACYHSPCYSDGDLKKKVVKEKLGILDVAHVVY